MLSGNEIRKRRDDSPRISTAMTELTDISPFQRLSAPSRALLGEAQLSVHPASPKPLIHKGQATSGAYFVLSGRLRVYSLAPAGTEATLYFIGPGETCVFALNSLFNGLRYPAWVQAVEETRLATIPGEIYRRLFAAEAAVRDLTVCTLATLVFRLMNELEEVHAYKLNQRLANLILVQSPQDGVLRATQQQLADHLGTTREVVARLVGELVQAQLIESRRGAIRIVDAGGLANLIANG